MPRSAHASTALRALALASRVVALAAVVSVAAAPLVAQGPTAGGTMRRLQLCDLYGLREVRDPQRSPDGKFLEPAAKSVNATSGAK